VLLWLSGINRFIFRNNITYVTYIVVGCVVMEAVYGNTIDYIWDTYNK
jgi:Ubiquinol-cytochrome C reductase, UQCRX/QCR9 like